MKTTEHEHVFGDPRQAKIGEAHMCRVENCTEIRVRHRRKVRWEKPTPDELITLVDRMMKDIAIADAMILIHGREHGLQRAREVLGYS